SDTTTTGRRSTARRLGPVTARAAHGKRLPHPQHRHASLDQDIVTGPTVENILPRSADEDVVARPTRQGVVAGTADEDIVAVAAICDELDRAGRQPRSIHHVIAGQGVDRQLVVGSLRALDVHLCCQAQHGHAAGVASHHGDVVAAGAVDDDAVGGTVAGAAAGRGLQVQVDLVDVGAGQVVDGDGVGAAQGVEVNPLDAVEVHRDVGDVAEETHARAVGGD